MAATVINTSGDVNGRTICLEEVVAAVEAAWTFQGIANTGLNILDTDASHTLKLVPSSNLTANRTLSIATGDASRTLTISGDTTLNQSVDTSASPTFVGLTVGGNVTLSPAAIGTGAVHGRKLFIGNNSSGNGTAGLLVLYDRSGAAWYLWVDTTGDLRISSAAPEEDGSPADTSGTIVGTQT